MGFLYFHVVELSDRHDIYVLLALVVLIMPEEFNTHPSPKVEEHINWYGNGQEQTIKAQAGCVSAALWEVFFHGG